MSTKSNPLWARYDELPTGGTPGATAIVAGQDANGLAVSFLVSDVAAASGGAYAGETSIVTLGTVTTGTWHGTAIGVAYGGTGLATLTAHALYVGNGASAPAAVAVGATGTVLAGATGADPAFSANIRITGSLGVGNSAAGSTPGTCVKKFAIYDAAGTLLGYVPIYDTIT